ncbi:MAG: response regulator [Ferruginibacter sp.]|nr:response regulator [Ferruginibacter sp.]
MNKMVNEQYHILVIDDNEDILFMIKAMLEMKGYKVTPKNHPENIELVIETIMPDIILMDMLLSGADGREVCKKIKTNAVISKIPVIMISALPDAGDSCMAAGANYFLGKPFEINDIFKTVATALVPVMI